MAKIDAQHDQDTATNEVSFLLPNFAIRIARLQDAEKTTNGKGKEDVDNSLGSLRIIAYTQIAKLKRLLESVNLESLDPLKSVIESVHNNIGNVTKNADKAQIQMDTPIGDELLEKLQSEVAAAIQSIEN